MSWELPLCLELQHQLFDSVQHAQDLQLDKIQPLHPQPCIRSRRRRRRNIAASNVEPTRTAYLTITMVFKIV